jgi:Tol biopolymer transport system component
MATVTATDEGVQPDAPPSFQRGGTPVTKIDEDLGTEDARAQVERILSCDQFRASARISSFLRYVTETALCGRAHEIKETSIGVSVYGRAPSYDPKLDTVVRTEARRLRKKLDQYFEEHGKSDPIRVSLPKGGYVPIFERISLTPELTDMPIEIESASRVTIPSIGIADTSGDIKRGSWQHRRLLVLAVFLISIAWIPLYWKHKPAPPSTAQQILPLTSLPGEAYQPDVSPDGRSVAFIWNNAGPYFNVYVAQAGGTPLRVTSSESLDMRPVWSPDGTSLAFLRVDKTGSHVMLTAFPGGAERLLFDLRSSRPWGEDQLVLRSDAGPNWTPDGKMIIVSDTAPSGQGLGLYQFDLASQKLTSLTNPSADQRDLNPVVSPDGAWIGFSRFSSYDSADVFLLSTSNHTERRLTTDRTDVQGLAWNRDSRSIIFSSNRAGAYQLWKTSVAGNDLVSIPTSGESAIQPAISRNGSSIVYADASLRSQLVKVQFPSSSGQSTGSSISPSTRRSHSAQFSPDSSHIAFVSDRNGKWELWVSDRNGDNARQVTNFNSASVGSPRWSPDTKTIAFDARPDGRSSIYIVSISGGRPQRLSPPESEEKQPTWSPDGVWIYFNSNRDGTMRLWKMHRDGSGAVPVSAFPATDPRFAPDGQHLLYTTSSPGLWALDLRSGDISQIKGLENTRFGRLWEVADGGIYFVDIASDRRRLLFYDLRSGHIQYALTLPEDPLVGYPSLTTSHLERSVVFSTKEDVRSDLMELRNQK